MTRLKIPVGVSDFEKIRQNGYYYVEKSPLISALLNSESTEVTLITRPRRFGKTMAMSMLAALTAFLFQQYDFLLASERVTEYDKTAFRRIVYQEASLAEIKTSFLLLTRMLHIHYGKPVILLMDEYDVPVSKASSNGYYQEMLNVVKAILSTALKDNPSLKFAVITGCLKITKESIFTGTNNFVSDRLSDKSGFGFGCGII